MGPKEIQKNGIFKLQKRPASKPGLKLIALVRVGASQPEGNPTRERKEMNITENYKFFNKRT